MLPMNPTGAKAATCVLCRRRKLRCDGGNPCGPCSRARTLVVCTYAPRTVGQLRTDLPKGGACLSCRHRKRKCDGQFPCMTCKATARPHECRFEERPRTRKHKTQPLVQPVSDSVSADGASSGSQSSKPNTPEYPTPLDLPPKDGIDLESLLACCFPDDTDLSGLLPNDHWLSGVDSQVLGISTLPDTLLLKQYPDLATTLNNQVELPRPPTPLNTLQFTNFSLDPAPAMDRTAEFFELRNLFLDHCWRYGLNVTAEKRDALSRGDMSGLVVHPVLVNVCQLLGYQLANRFPSDAHQFCRGETAGREAEQAMTIFDILEASVDLDRTTAMQVYNLLGGYYAIKGDLPMFTQLFQKAGAIVLENSAVLGLDDTLLLDPDPVSGCPQGLAQEARSAFSAMIFLELTVILVLKSPPVLDVSLLTKFRRLATIHRLDTEMNFMRARSVLILYDTKCLVAEWIQLKFGDPARTAWAKRYWNLIEDIQSHLRTVDTPLIEVSFIHTAQVFTLKTCIIIALAALADLYALFAPFQPEALRKRDAVVEEIAGITNMFVGSDFQHLDTTLGICWAVALRPLVGDVRCPNWDDLTGRSPRPDGGPSQASLDMIRDCFQRLRQSTPSLKAHCMRGS
ncbi:hypothetical protein DFH06DRAFT_607761 [Mycena polygramma]|nr:hypothetical protein DFH06DRAFT_607761 [Mycena polygramma]